MFDDINTLEIIENHEKSENFNTASHLILFQMDWTNKPYSNTTETKKFLLFSEFMDIPNLKQRCA